MEAPEKSESVAICESDEKKLPEGTAEQLKASLAFSYPHKAATSAPSKQTATQRKGRLKDEEAAQQAEVRDHAHRQFRKPAFAGESAQGTAYGNAVHEAMQYIRFDRCGSEESIREEIQRLVSRKLLTGEQGSMINCGALARFFATEIGKKLRGGAEHIREFKFSILDDGRNFSEELIGEQVLLQGVVDCAILEEDGITVLDFKTDYVTEENLPLLVERYRPQVQTYAHALSRIYGKPIKESFLYFFRLNRFISV